MRRRADELDTRRIALWKWTLIHAPLHWTIKSLNRKQTHPAAARISSSKQGVYTTLRSCFVLLCIVIHCIALRKPPFFRDIKNSPSSGNHHRTKKRIGEFCVGSVRLLTLHMKRPCQSLSNFTFRGRRSSAFLSRTVILGGHTCELLVTKRCLQNASFRPDDRRHEKQRSRKWGFVSLGREQGKCLTSTETVLCFVCSSPVGQSHYGM